MKHRVTNVLGWIGVACVLCAYAGNVFGSYGADSFAYLGLNAAGALLIVIETLAKKDYQPALLNVAWLLIALVAMMHAF